MNEILEIISSLDYNKAVLVNSILIKILKLPKEQIAEHLRFIHNLSFTTGIFPDSLKIAKVTPMGFLNDQKILYENQLGIQKNFSITHAVISLIKNIEKAIENKVFVCGVFLDLQKAFDTADHNTLLYKPSHYRIRDSQLLVFFLPF